jgi:uncharacterized protein (TIGR01777 family)
VNILVTGATGFIGSALVRRLTAAGHTVSALSRSPERQAGSGTELTAVHAWQPLEGPPRPEVFAGIDAVVHLAGEPVDGRWTEKKKRAIRESRELGTRNLVTGMLAAPTPPPVLVSMSAIGIYGQRGDEEVTEETPPGDDFLAGVARAWEAEAERAGTGGVRVVVLRNGLVFGRGGGAFERLLLPARLGAGGPLGGGRQWWSWVHLDDVVGVIVHALEHDDVRGPLNVTAPNPQRQRDVAKALGRVLHRPAFLPAPAFALRLVLGEFSKEVLGSIRVLPRRTEASGYRFAHPDLDEALRDLLR